MEGFVHEFILIADVAKKRDRFTLMLFQDTAEVVDGNKILETPDKVIHHYDIKLIEQYQGLGYEDQADRIFTIMQNPKLRMNTDLLLDGTGVGDAVVELVRKRGLYPIPIIFTGGGSVTEHYEEMGKVFGNTGKLQGARILKDISIPKKDLVDAGQIMLQQGRLRIAPGKWNGEFRKQLEKFKGKVNEKGNKKYEAETEEVHDDLVVVFLMGSWWILNRKEKGAPERRADHQETVEYNPLDYC